MRLTQAHHPSQNYSLCSAFLSRGDAAGPDQTPPQPAPALLPGSGEQVVSTAHSFKGSAAEAAWLEAITPGPVEGMRSEGARGALQTLRGPSVGGATRLGHMWLHKAAPLHLPNSAASSCLPWRLVPNASCTPQTPSQLCLQTSQPAPLSLTHPCHPGCFTVSFPDHCSGLPLRPQL